MTTAKMMANISRGLHFTAGTIQSSLLLTHLGLASLVASWLKNPPAKAGDVGWIPGQKDPLEKEMGNPLQSCCLGNPMDRGAWWATINGVARVEHDLATKPPPPPHSQASPRPCLWLERVVLKLQCLRGEPHGELINRADSGGFCP